MAIKIPTVFITNEDTWHELQTMSKLRHRNVLGLIGVVEDGSYSFADWAASETKMSIISSLGFHLVFEFMENGSLVHLLTHKTVSNVSKAKPELVF